MDLDKFDQVTIGAPRAAAPADVYPQLDLENAYGQYSRGPHNPPNYSSAHKQTNHMSKNAEYELNK